MINQFSSVQASNYNRKHMQISKAWSEFPDLSDFPFSLSSLFIAACWTIVCCILSSSYWNQPSHCFSDVEWVIEWGLSYSLDFYILLPLLLRPFLLCLYHCCLYDYLGSKIDKTNTAYPPLTISLVLAFKCVNVSCVFQYFAVGLLQEVPAIRVATGKNDSFLLEKSNLKGLCHLMMVLI